MAANLKASTFRFNKWALLILLSLLIAVYLKWKIDQFWEQCRSAEEERKTTQWSFLTSIWRWISSTWLSPQEHQSSDNVQSQSDRQNQINKCDSSHMDIILYVIMDSVHMDATLFCVKLIELVTSYVVDTVWASVSAMQSGFAVLFNKIQPVFNSMWAVVVQTCQNLTLPNGVFGMIIVIFACVVVIFIIFRRWRKQIYWKKRTNFHEDYLSRHPYNDCTLSNTRSLKPGIQSQPVERSVVRRRMPYRPTPTEFESADQMTCGRELCTCVGQTRRTWRPVLVVVYMMGVLLCVSIPWEFCRLYQLAVARKAAVASAGLPAECNTASLSFLQTLTLWLSWQLAWSHGNPCDHYYEAMFVDPLWEITPFMVLVSMVTRCIVHPTEMLASGLGRALRHFFTEIPLHWQPVCLLVMVTLILILLITACSYRFSIPMLFEIEPKSPPVLASKRRYDEDFCQRGDGVCFPCKDQLQFHDRDVNTAVASPKAVLSSSSHSSFSSDQYHPSFCPGGDLSKTQTFGKDVSETMATRNPRGRNSARNATTSKTNDGAPTSVARKTISESKAAKNSRGKSRTRH